MVSVMFRLGLARPTSWIRIKTYRPPHCLHLIHRYDHMSKEQANARFHGRDILRQFGNFVNRGKKEFHDLRDFKKESVILRYSFRICPVLFDFVPYLNHITIWNSFLPHLLATSFPDSAAVILF